MYDNHSCRYRKLTRFTRPVFFSSQNQVPPSILDDMLQAFSDLALDAQLYGCDFQLVNITVITT